MARPNDQLFPAVEDRTHRRRRPSYRWRRDRTEVPIVSHESLQLSAVRPVAKSSLVTGTVVWAHIPFEEGTRSKLRPAVVTAVAGRVVTVLPATSADSRRRYPTRHHELIDLRAAGLHRATAVRLAEVTLDLIDVVSVAGALGPEDHRALTTIAERPVVDLMEGSRANPEANRPDAWGGSLHRPTYAGGLAILDKRCTASYS